LPAPQPLPRPYFRLKYFARDPGNFARRARADSSIADDQR
jgi:hypothetical protein